jgi:VanZ family protein
VANKIILGAAIFWTLTIAILCLIQMNDLPEFQSIDIPGKDKYVHCTFHLVFTLLWSGYFWNRQKSIEIKTVFKVFLVSVCYGILIEILQGEFTTTRKADVFDVLANTTGATIAVMALLCYKHFSKSKN